MKTFGISLARGLGAAVLGVLLWQAVVTLADLPRFILPAPLLVAETLWKSRVLILENAWFTLIEVLVGLFLGAILGGLSAIGLAASPFARSFLRPMLVFSQAVPVFALADHLFSGHVGLF